MNSDSLYNLASYFYKLSGKVIRFPTERISPRVTPPVEDLPVNLIYHALLNWCELEVFPILANLAKDLVKDISSENPQQDVLDYRFLFKFVNEKFNLSSDNLLKVLSESGITITPETPELLAENIMPIRIEIIRKLKMLINLEYQDLIDS